MQKNILIGLARDLAGRIREETALPSRRRELSRLVATTPLAGFRSLERPPKGEADRTRRIDTWAEACFLARSSLLEQFPQLVVITEERGVLFHPPDYEPARGTDFPLLLLDPVDNTELVIRRLGGAVTALLATAHRGEEGLLDSIRIESAVVVDIAGGEAFFTSRAREGVQDSAESQQERLQVLTQERDTLAISSVAIKPERLQPLLEGLARLGSGKGPPCRFFLHHGGPLPLCRVAAGDFDVAFDLTRGYKAFDYAAGLWIASRAGCHWLVRDQRGNDLPDFDPASLRVPPGPHLNTQFLALLEERTQFVVARSRELLDLIVERF